jgi:hypothetical protein
MNKLIYQIFSKDEITISDIWKIVKISIKKSLWLSIIIMSAFYIYALFDYKTRPIEYRAEAHVRVEDYEKTNSKIESLSSLFGDKDQNATGKILGPEMFGEIINSKAFLNDLVISKIPINENGADSTTLESYFQNFQNISKLQKLKSLILNKEIKITNKKVDEPKKIDFEKVVQEEINSDILFSQTVPPIVTLRGSRSNAMSIMQGRIDFKFIDGKASVFVKMPDPLLSAVTTKLVLEKIIDFVTKYKTKKQVENLKYIEQKFTESQNKYKIAQNKYSGYKDASLGVILQSAQINDQILSNNSTILFNIYNQFALQLEQAKFELKKEAPLFFVLEPISIPGAKFEPNFQTILLKKISLGFVFVVIIFISNLFLIKNEE